MKTLPFLSIVLLFLSSCITTTQLHYSDPNYLGSAEFIRPDNTASIPSEELEITETDKGIKIIILHSSLREIKVKEIII